MFDDATFQPPVARPAAEGISMNHREIRWYWQIVFECYRCEGSFASNCGIRPTSDIRKIRTPRPITL
jgi:hypothetical protein